MPWLRFYTLALRVTVCNGEPHCESQYAKQIPEEEADLHLVLPTRAITTSEGYRSQAEEAQKSLEKADARVADALHQATKSAKDTYEPQLERLRRELQTAQVRQCLYT